jgi:hypothetical protein
MQLDDHVTQVQEQLLAAGALGDDRTRDIAAALTTAAGPAVRLAVLDAVGAAADEITAALLDLPGSPAVSVRMDGNEVLVSVQATDAEPVAVALDEGDTTARISLRLSETLKAEIDTAAARDGVSVNTWLIRAATGALADSSRGRARRRPDHHHDDRRVTGWING